MSPFRDMLDAAAVKPQPAVTSLLDPSVGSLSACLDEQVHIQDHPNHDVSEATRITELYAFEREIGRGHFGIVRTCTHKKTGQTRACKTILKTSIKRQEDMNELSSEVMTMAKLKKYSLHPESTVRLYEVYEDSESVHLVMDYCPGGDLFDHVARNKRLQEWEAAQIVRQLAAALQDMHSCGVVHRDMKPENVLLSEKPKEKGGSWKLKVADFGLCIHVEPGQQGSGVAGSPFYMAPEVIMGHPYGPEVDVWSLGVILYTCLAGSLPFYGKTHDAIFTSVLKGQLDLARKPWPLVSFDAKSLMIRMLDRDPKKRMKLSDVLLSPWILRHCPDLSPRKGPLGRALIPTTRSLFRQEAILVGDGASSGRSQSPSGAQRCPSYTHSSDRLAAGHTVSGKVEALYKMSPSIALDTTEETGSLFTPASGATQESFSFGSSLTQSSAASSPSVAASGLSGRRLLGHLAQKKLQAADLPRHRLPADSRKGFSAPLGRHIV